MFDYIVIDKESEDKEDHVYEVNGMTDDLKEAIRYFFLVVAERHIRGQSVDHNSMMINFQYLTKLQSELYLHVNDYVKKLQDAISSNSSFPLKHARKSSYIKLLEETFDKVFVKTSEIPRSFEEMLKHLKQANSIKVVEVHYKSDQLLDYDNWEDGLNVIAIGGFSLSRGLTLRGLSVSFLDRTTKASDTLLQMGRWFGYRDHYGDLCRIYIDGQSRAFFYRINETLDELYEELETMTRAGLTPKDFGIQVRDHAGGLIITARSKMRTAQIATVNMSFWGQKYQSVWLPNEVKDMKANQECVEKLIKNLNPELKSLDEKANGYVWRKVSYTNIRDFLDEFNESVRSDNENMFIREFLKEMKDEFSSWTIQLVTNMRPSREAGKIRGKEYSSINITDGINLFGGLRKFLDPENNIIKTDRSQIGASNLDELILTKSEYDQFKDFKKSDEGGRNNAQAARTALKEPVLTIYPIIPFNEDDNEQRKILFPDLECIFLYSLTIPRLMSDGTHPVKSSKKYALNKTAINILKERISNLEEDKKLAQISEEDPNE